MKELNDKDLILVRLRFIDLMKSFFVSQPDSERLSRWRGTFAALVKDQVTPEIDTAARDLNSQLTSKKLEDLQDEYYALFTDPFSENHLNMMASHYIDGRNYGNTLITLRQFLHDSSINVDNSLGDSEDSLPVMLDILITLVEQEKNGDDTSLMQSELVNNFLLPCIDHLSKSAAENQSAHFFDECIRFCKGYLNLEKSLAT
jgi:TorA maturation chaperone TorD